jgi:electron transfer flavoprotein beta subunit
MALAMGADRALLIATEANLEPLALARALLAIVERERPMLALLGKQAIDDDQAQTGPMLAALWDRPQATFVSSLVVAGSVARASREVDRGIETIEIDLPGVVTTDLRLNEPRLVKLPDILKARRKVLDVLPFRSLGIETQPQFRVVWTAPSAPRPAGVKVGGVAELVAELRRRGTL